MPDRFTVRRRVAHTQRLWRRIPSWRRAALASCVVVAALVQLGGSVAAVNSPDQVGEWSAPSPWPIVAVHMSLEPTGLCLRTRRVQRGAQLRAPVGSGVRRIRPGAVRAEPFLLGTRPTRGRPHPDRRRPYQCQRGAGRHDHLQSADELLRPRSGHVRRAVVSDRDGAARWARTRLCGRQHRPGPSGRSSAALGRVSQLPALGLQPEDEHVDRPARRRG